MPLILPLLASILLLAQQAPGGVGADIDAMLEARCEKHDVPGAAAWVSRRGEPVIVAAIWQRFRAAARPKSGG